MTVLVGLESGGSVYLCADSAVSQDDDIITLTDSKLFEVRARSTVIMGGACGCARTGQLIKYGLKITSYKNSSELDYLVNDFAFAVRDLLKNHDLITSDGEMEAQLLFGFRGNLYKMDEGFHIARVMDGYYALGSGGPYATGAMYAMRESKMDPEKKLGIAANAAVRFCSSVCRPIHHMTLPPVKRRKGEE